MVREVLTHLQPERGGVFVDCTVGLGGHARALLAAGATRVVGLDRDPEALAVAGHELAGWGDRVDLVHADYRDVTALLDRRGLDLIDGALADLGVSSFQLEAEGRGFSFRRDEPLDMRFDRSAGPTAAELMNAASEQALAGIIESYGEERHARRIARAVVRARTAGPVRTTGELAALVGRAVPRRGRDRIHPATRTFQALRIWVNRELDGLDRFVGTVVRRLRAGGRLVVISFHSLEDRAVKHALRALERGEGALVRLLTKKPMRPGPDELQRNPRTRSARLRAAERLGPGLHLDRTLA
jgi:16S rRNA (cytosine1402-N4)-methyltransferase